MKYIQMKPDEESGIRTYIGKRVEDSANGRDEKRVVRKEHTYRIRTF
jgi:hypothetical protein